MQFALAARQTSQPIAIAAGTVVAVTPAAGATALVEYTAGTIDQINSGAATWSAWANGTVGVLARDAVSISGFARVTASGGSVAVDVRGASEIGGAADVMRRLRSAADKGALPVPAAAVVTATVTGSWTPTQVPAGAAANSYGWSEQIFTVATMLPGDVPTSVTPPSAMTDLAVVATRWVSATQVAITFKNGNKTGAVAAQTPPSGTWTVNIARFASGLPADVPLVTLSAQGAATALGANTKTFLAGSGNVRMRHPYLTNSGFGASYALSAAMTISPGFRFGYYQGVEFMTDAPKMEILTTTYSGPFTIIVDGKHVLAAPIASSAKNDAGYRLTIDFTQGGTITLGTRKARKIRFEVGGSGHFGGLVVTKADSVWVPNNPNAIKGVINGDSYVQGTNSQHPLLGMLNYNQEAFANRLGDLLGWDECVNVGIASTGYVATAGGSSQKFRDRIADIISLSPDVVVQFGSINDQPYTSTLQAEVTTYYQQLTAALPNAIIFVAGVQNPRDSYSVGAANTLVKNGVAAVGSPNLFFIDMVSPTPWVSGNGSTAAPVNDGNADVITGSDSVHPSMDGHAYYTRMFGNAIGAIIKANT